MHDRFYLGAYWGARRETAEACAERLADCLVRLAECGALLGRWSTTLGADGLSEVVDPMNLDGLGRLMLEGVNRCDVGGGVIEELGYRVGLWNGNDEAAVGLSVGCGGWSEAHAHGLMNSFSLSLPTPREAGELYDLRAGLSAMRAAATAWELDWATLTSHALSDSLNVPPRVPTVGWITFLANRHLVPNGVPVSFSERLPGGTILVSTSRADEVGLANLRSLSDALRSAGSLAPTP